MLLICALHRAAYPPGLPQVASVVSRDDMKACGKTERDTSHEGVWKPDAGQIKVGVRA